jgi:glycosyltransferase involved in cell wall biosynthesis
MNMKDCLDKGTKPEAFRTVCVIIGGMTNENITLQPWRYVAEIFRQLDEIGHPVTLITDYADEWKNMGSITIKQIPSVSNPYWRENSALVKTLQEVKPEVLIVNYGFLSFFHQRMSIWSSYRTIGIITSPYYTFVDFKKTGLINTLMNIRFYSVHLFTALLPKIWLRNKMSSAKFKQLVVQTQTLKDVLLSNNFWNKTIQVIPPGVNEIWQKNHFNSNEEIRKTLGFNSGDWVVVFFGSAAPMRGLRDLLKAAKIARKQIKSLKLLILCRADGRSNPEKLITRDNGYISLLREQLAPEALLNYVAASDAAALPFRMVPSDAPISLLEAHALGKPIITTRTACLPELVKTGQYYLANPADPAYLANALIHAWQERNIFPKNCYTRQWKEVGTDWCQLVQNLE